MRRRTRKPRPFDRQVRRAVLITAVAVAAVGAVGGILGDLWLRKVWNDTRGIRRV